MKKTILSTITFVLVSLQTALASNSYNLPLEISEIALGGRGGDGGTDKNEFVMSTNSFGVVTSNSRLGDGRVTNNGVDLSIVEGWDAQEFGNDPISIRLLQLNASP